MSESYDTQTSVQYGQDLDYYINGLGISNDVTAPNTQLDIAPGSCLDSTGTYQLNLNVPVVINGAINGLNGLDTGTLAASKVYAVYMVWDPVHNHPAGAVISLSYVAPLLPLIPFHYSAFLLIGYVTTNSSAYFVKGYWSAGNSSQRMFTYDAFQPTAVTAGTSTSYAHVDLTALVPLVNNVPVQVYSSFLPTTAGDTLSLQAGNATGAQAIVTGQVASIHVTTIKTILAQTVAISTVPSPVINYILSAAGAVAIDVAGYQWFV